MLTWFKARYDDFICLEADFLMTYTDMIHVSQFFDIPLQHIGVIKYRNGKSKPAANKVFHTFKLCLN